MQGTHLIHYLLTLVLYFDGSWYPPISASKSRRINSSACIPSCSACCFIDRSPNNNWNNDNNCSSTDDLDLLAIGAKCLSKSSCLSSAHAEYEGVILGLEMLIQLLSKCINHDDSISHIYTDSKCEVIIRGDCKTVIQQLQEVSVSRKLMAQYERYLGLKRCLLHSLSGIMDISLSYQLISREDNEFADYVGRKITYCVQDSLYEHLYDDSLHSNDIDMLTTYQKLDECKKYLLPSQLFVLLSNVANKCIDDFKSQQMNNVHILERIGSEFRTNSQYFFHGNKIQRFIRAKGIRYEIEAMINSNRDSEALAFMNRYRYILNMDTVMDCDLRLEANTSERETASDFSNLSYLYKQSVVYKEWRELLNEMIHRDDAIGSLINLSVVNFIVMDV